MYEPNLDVSNAVAQLVGELLHLLPIEDDQKIHVAATLEREIKNVAAAIVKQAQGGGHL